MNDFHGIPRCCAEHRLGWLNGLDALVTLDAFALGNDLLAIGWPVGDVPETIAALGRYLSGRITYAVEVAANGWTPEGGDTVPPSLRPALGAHRRPNRDGP